MVDARRRPRKKTRRRRVFKKPVGDDDEKNPANRGEAIGALAWQVELFVFQEGLQAAYLLAEGDLFFQVLALLNLAIFIE